MAEPTFTIDLHIRGRHLHLQSHARVLGLMGPSGSGKTTLLGALAGTLPHTRGLLRIGGRTFQNGPTPLIPAHHRQIGWAPQDPLLFPHLDVEANLRFGERPCPADSPELGFEPIIQTLGLQPLLKRAVRHLSGGERQRVALGRALLTRPFLLLLDEPFTALDRALNIHVRTTLAHTLTVHIPHIVLVSHDPADHLAFGAETYEIVGTGIAPIPLT